MSDRPRILRRAARRLGLGAPASGEQSPMPSQPGSAPPTASGERRTTLHLGAPKTGTTFLQTVLFANKERLAGHGVLLPGQRANDHALAAIGMREGESSRHHAVWQDALAEMDRWDGPAILSNEWFPMADSARTAETLERLQQGRELHLVMTVRDLVDQVPAAWQETLKLGDSTQIDEFAVKMERPDFRWGWSILDPAEVLDRWAPGIPPERVHLVTVPPRGAPPGTLWSRFASACGIEPDWCSTDVEFARESLSVEAARLLQLAGPRLLEAIDAEPPNWNGPRRWIQKHLAHGMLLKRRGGRITMSPETIAAVRERSERSVERLRAAGYTVHGDYADLVSSRLPESAVHPDAVPDSEVLDLALDLVAAQLRHTRRTANKAARAAKG
ncbi:hypothetical protein Q6350_06105 [Isoptericola sp. b515]|uniref:hypothetical protein n=1 Tax=Isoptericola sp. b515 TaxID=3064652 RepID=UPI00271387F8|nr:hypothetical protein [Isoptericola sp. b515]MDO8148000.1 hypothetical protein [Isoptericola sp. b515]